MRLQPGDRSKQTRRMHTVPSGYLESFAVRASGRKQPSVWRIERATGSARFIRVRDASVVRDIYAIFGDGGSKDVVVEDTLLNGIDGSFCAVRDILVSGQEPRYWQWRDLSRFLAFQIARTPRQFQSLRDEYAFQGLEADQNEPQKAMVLGAPHLENWICRLHWAVCRNESEYPFLTSDNPVVFWSDRGAGLEIGAGFEEPKLQIYFPISPHLCFTARHSRTSRAVIIADRVDTPSAFTTEFDLNIVAGVLTNDQVKRANLLTIANADRCVYSSYRDDVLLRFLHKRFIGQSSPVRRRDLRPFGSPADSSR